MLKVLLKENEAKIKINVKFSYSTFTFMKPVVHIQTPQRLNSNVLVTFPLKLPEDISQEIHEHAQKKQDQS